MSSGKEKFGFKFKNDETVTLFFFLILIYTDNKLEKKDLYYALVKYIVLSLLFSYYDH